jgi:hypothetical protein
VPTRNGNACVLSIKDDEFPGSNIVEVTDEKLLEKLRSVNGQLVYEGLPVFYYEHLNSGLWNKLFGHKATTIRTQSPRFLFSLSPRIGEKIRAARSQI